MGHRIVLLYGRTPHRASAPGAPPSPWCGMPLSGRSNDPRLDEVARSAYALFPHCHRCGEPVESFEDADVRVHVQRVVHRGGCPPVRMTERLVSAAETP